jgi:putative DNA primase/helicase
MSVSQQSGSPSPKPTIPFPAQDDSGKPSSSEARPGAGVRPVATFADLQQVVSETAWLWPGHIPRGQVTLVAGDPGMGKSLLALDLARRCLDGGMWPDGSPCQRMESVMIADTEGTQSVTLARLVRLGIAPNRVQLPLQEPLGDLLLDDAQLWGAFRAIVMRERPGLVIVDSLCGSSRGDEDNSRHMTDVLGKLQRLARDANVAILVIHHTRKRQEIGEPLTLNHVRGSSAIAANARAVFGIEPLDLNDRDGMRRFKMLKANLSPMCDPLGFVLDEDRVEWVELPEAAEIKSQLEKAMAFVQEQLAGGPVEAKEMKARASKAGISWRTMGRAKSDLNVISGKRKGASDSCWEWSLPPRPKAADV